MPCHLPSLYSFHYPEDCATCRAWGGEHETSDPRVGPVRPFAYVKLGLPTFRGLQSGRRRVPASPERVRGTRG
jgi:hypothetical protein